MMPRSSQWTSTENEETRNGTVMSRLVHFPRREPRRPEEQRTVHDTFARLHFRRLRITVLLLIPLGLFFIGSDLLTLQAGREPLTARWYLVLDTLFLIVQAAMLGILLAPRAAADGPRHASGRLVYVYAQVILVWAALVSAFELQASGNTTAVVIAMMGVSMLALLSLRALAALLLSSSAVFFVAATVLAGMAPPQWERILFIVGLLVVCLLVSHSLRSALAERVIATDRLARANAQLHTVQMTLIQKEKFATIGQLSAGIAHEINNPLGYLKSNFSTLEQSFRHLADTAGRAGGDPATTWLLSGIDDIFRDARDGFRHIGEVIDNLRSFSYTPPADYFGSYDLVRGIESTLVLARSACAGVARVEKDLDPVPDIEAKGSEINQVLLNLIMNAIDAIRFGGATAEGWIRLSARSDGLWVTCDVSDSGPGVPAEIRSRIFDPFFTTKPAGEGLGLGLSLSYEIVVHRHHGTLQLREGTPTTFRMRLPVLQPARQEGRK